MRSGVGTDIRRCEESVMRTARQNHLAGLVLCVLMLLSAAEVAGQQHPTLVSVNSAGTGSGNARSGDFNTYRISSDGRYVVFYSEATDLVPLGAIRASDIFVRDLQTGTTTMVSINAAGTASTGVSSFGLITDNGRYVAFNSFANNIVTNDTNSSPDVFLRDLQAGTTRLVSINAAGTASAKSGGGLIDMTPDGRFITFSGQAEDLTPHPDGNGLGSDIYVRDTVNNVTSLVTVNTAGTASGNGSSFGGSISADGRYVVFTSSSSDLVANDTGTRDVFLRDIQAGTTIRLSNNAAGTAGGNNSSSDGVIDRGGRFVVFGTMASDLSTLPDTNNLADIFIYDVQAGTKRLITVNAAGTATGNGLGTGFFQHVVHYSISDDARFVAFMSQSGNLVTNDTNGNGDDIFRYEVATQAKSLVSVNLAGTSGISGGSDNPTISADGRFVAFNSLANDLVNVADETNGATHDVFVRDMVAGQTYLASVNSAGTRTGNGFSFQPFISADGTRLVFHSRAGNLITNDLNDILEDVFVFTIASNGGPVLLTEQNTQRAVALDSVTQTRDPFSLVNLFNFSSDRRTRVSLFVWRLDLLPGDDASAVTAQAEDEQGSVYPLTVEYLGATPALNEVTQVVVKLPVGVSAPADLWITISLRGATTNKALIKIKPP
jgi:Tol biopolymer transport system component